LSTTQASSRLVLLILVNAWMKNDGYTSLLPPGVVRESLHINDGTAAEHNFKQKQQYQIDDLALIVVKTLSEGQHTLKLTVIMADEFGVDIDKVTLNGPCIVGSSDF